MPVKVRGALTDWLEVHPGDIVVGDGDGLIVIPQALLEDVRGKVIEWSNSDSSARTAIQQGMPLLKALEKFGHL